MIWVKAHLAAFIRDSRSGALRVVIIALVVAVTAVTSVGFFTDRIRLAMEQRSGELLGADVRIEASTPVASIYRTKATEEGLAVSRQVEFPSVILDSQGMPKLVAVKVVEAGYPLRGRLRVSDQLFEEGTETDAVPAFGTLWVGATLLAESGLQLGQSIKLGASVFRLARVLSYEPDNTGIFSQLAAPRVMMNRIDLEAAELLSAASRARHRLLVAGDPKQVAAFIGWARERDDPSVRIRTIRDVEPEIRTALDRAASYLGLASITAIVIAGAAILLAMRLYARQQQDASAVMRCLGASQGYVLRNFLGRVLFAAGLASAIGCAAGLIAQEFLASLASSALQVELPAPSFRPLLAGVIVGTVVALGFGLAPILSLRQVPVLRLLRSEHDMPRPSSILSTGIALAATFVVLLWQGKDLMLATWVIASLLVLMTALLAIGASLVWFVRRLPVRHTVVRYALANLGRRPGIVILQVVALGTGIMALLLLTVIRVDLLDNWQRTVPDNAPNRFVINIQPDQQQGVVEMLEEAGLTLPGIFPMARGRLVPEKSDGEWRGWNSSGPGESGEVPSEFNLSFSDDLPVNNELIAGRWWTDDASHGEWSLEEGIAGSLGLEVGDMLTFAVGENEVTGQVSNLRRVAWDSFQVNFFMIGKPSMLERYPATFITSFYLPDNRAQFAGDLVRRFPGITVFDVGALIDQVRSIIREVSTAVQYVFAFTLFAGLVVLYAAVQVSARERMREIAILRSLGARRRRIWGTQLTEFMLLGAMAGLVAAVFASVAGFFLSKDVFELPFDPGPAVFIYGIVGGAAGVGAAGLLAVQRVVRRPVLQSLQRL